MWYHVWHFFPQTFMTSIDCACNFNRSSSLLSAINVIATASLNQAGWHSLCSTFIILLSAAYLLSSQNAICTALIRYKSVGVPTSFQECLFCVRYVYVYRRAGWSGAPRTLSYCRWLRRVLCLFARPWRVFARHSRSWPSQTASSSHSTKQSINRNQPAFKCATLAV